MDVKKVAINVHTHNNYYTLYYRIVLWLFYGVMYRTILMDNNTRYYHFCSTLFISNLDFSSFQLFAAFFCNCITQNIRVLKKKICGYWWTLQNVSRWKRQYFVTCLWMLYIFHFTFAILIYTGLSVFLSSRMHFY